MSAESINLRNIVWHGFPLPNEIPTSFVSTLFVVAASLFSFVENIPITPRGQVKDFSRHLSKIRAAQIDFDLVDKISLVEATIESSEWTEQWEIYWKQLYEHYLQKNYWRCAILILPQIELVLRKMYGEANNFDISAKLNEYYITMNSIFESTNNNQLLNSDLSKRTLHFLYDIFISPFGMRIRDKISHGEVDLDCLDRSLCSVLLYAGLNLLNKREFPLDSYRSKFHLNYLTYEALMMSKRSVLELMTMKTPSNLKFKFKWNLKAMMCLEKLILMEPVEIFHRSKQESDIFMSVMKIAQLIVQICSNYQMSFNERFAMLVNHELRSRARKTLEKTVDTFGVVAENLANIVGSLFNIANQKYFDTNFDENKRFCKHTLTIVENLVRYSDKDNNEWLKALECIERFFKISSNFCSKSKES